MRICILFLSSILYCLNVFSASKSVVQKTVRMGDVVYIDQHGSLIQVDMKRVTVKPKTGALDKNIEPLLSNKLGYFTLQVPDGVLVEDYVNELTRTGDYETVEYIGMGTINYFDIESFISGKNSPYINPRTGSTAHKKQFPISNPRHSFWDFYFPLTLKQDNVIITDNQISDEKKKLCIFS